MGIAVLLDCDIGQVVVNGIDQWNKYQKQQGIIVFVEVLFQFIGDWNLNIAQLVNCYKNHNGNPYFYGPL